MCIRDRYNDGRFRNRNEKVSHIRKVRGSTSMSARNGHILNEIIPLTIELPPKALPLGK